MGGRVMIRPIKSVQDHQTAKERMEDLILSSENKDVSDEIEVLATLIEKYERSHIITEAPSALAAIKLRMEQKNLSARDLEPFIGSRARVSEVLSGKRKLSMDMVRALHEGLGIPYESLMKKEEIGSATSIEVSQPVLTKLKEFGFDLKLADISDFLKSAFGQQYVPRLNRKTRTQRASGKTDQNALLIWQGAVLTKAMRNPPIGEFTSSAINKRFLRSIAQLSTHPQGPLRAVNELSKHGVIVVILPVLPGTFLDGAVMLLNGRTPVIGLTLRHDRTDNFWFTLLHELAHLAKHFDILSSSDHVFFDELDIETDDEIEAQADSLAKNCLVPSKHARVCKNKFASTEQIENASEEAGVHVSIVAGRWQKEHGDYKKFSRLIERNSVRDMLQSA
tara:strand:- start:4184 stop:5362 length:1179 start_codon:yes stop_codon:yes gene_type:complete